MNEENTRKLLGDFPMLYGQKDTPMTQSLMCFGFECGDGWYDIIRRLSEKLERWNEENSNDDMPPIEACQVKEKFGGLRFYVDNCPEEMHEHIHAAEHESETTCDRCGKPGKSRGGGWIRTLCDDCDAEHKKVKAEREAEYERLRKEQGAAK